MYRYLPPVRSASCSIQRLLAGLGPVPNSMEWMVVLRVMQRSTIDSISLCRRLGSAASVKKKITSDPRLTAIRKAGTCSVPPDPRIPLTKTAALCFSVSVAKINPRERDRDPRYWDGGLVVEDNLKLIDARQRFETLASSRLAILKALRRIRSSTPIDRRRRRTSSRSLRSRKPSFGGRMHFLIIPTPRCP